MFETSSVSPGLFTYHECPRFPFHSRFNRNTATPSSMMYTLRGAFAFAKLPTAFQFWLLAFVFLHEGLDFGLDSGQVEGGWVLHWRIVDGRSKLTDGLLHDDQAPELARIELVHVATAHVIQRLASDRGGRP
jgi:hypothetical protein